MCKKHQQLFNQFTATFQPHTIVSWEKLISTWKMDRSSPNPYLEPSSCKLIFIIPVLIPIEPGY